MHITRKVIGSSRSTPLPPQRREELAVGIFMKRRFHVWFITTCLLMACAAPPPAPPAPTQTPAQLCPTSTASAFDSGETLALSAPTQAVPRLCMLELAIHLGIEV